MAHKTLFRSGSRRVSAADTRNRAGGLAYNLPPREALAQVVMTGFLGGTFYASAEQELDQLLDLLEAEGVDATFVGKLAVYARRNGYMKDAPALLVGALSVMDESNGKPGILEAVFPKVIDNGKMLSTFVQILRSGVLGRRAMSARLKRLVQGWFDARDDEGVFRASFGQQPNLADVLRLAHPKPGTDSRRALFGYISGRNPEAHAVDQEVLPEIVRQYLAFGESLDVEQMPNLDFRALDRFPLTREHWARLAERGNWHWTRMNLNTLLRHGVLADDALTRKLASRLANPEEVRKARAFPYQLLAAYKHVRHDMPGALMQALHDAMEVALENIPKLDGPVYVFPDVSWSMNHAITGLRTGGTTKMRRVDVAGLIAAALARRNPENVTVWPFNNSVVDVRVEPRDTVMTTAGRLSDLCGGGTNCSAPLERLNRTRADVAAVVFVSDDESWMDSHGRTFRRGTGLFEQWCRLRDRCPQAKMVCIDLEPNREVQAPNNAGILNVGGFSDEVFRVTARMLDGSLTPGHWLGIIEAVEL